MSTINITTITPELASQLLRGNHRNRNVNSVKVRALANDITTGRFVFNGDAIRVSNTGVLLDGQHRLLAVLEADKAIETILVEGLPDDVQQTIDTGHPRTLADTLTMEHGVPNANVVAAVTQASLLFQANNGTFLSRIAEGNRNPTRAEQVEWFLSHEGTILSAARQAGRLVKSIARIPTTATAITLFGANLVDPLVADDFTQAVIDGSGPENDPARQLREYGIRRSQANHKAPSVNVHLVVARSWNKWIQGELVSKLMSRKSVTDSPRITILDHEGRQVFPIAETT